MMKSIGSAALAIALLASAAAAQTTPPPPREACKADVMKFCASAMGDRPAMKQCMKSHVADLSPECKMSLMAKHAAKAGDAPAH